MSVLKEQGMMVTNLALLHAGGWDEVLMIAVGLAAAWAIITWTGRSRSYEDDDEEDDDSEVAAGDEVVPGPGDRPLSKPNRDRDNE